MKFLKLFVLGLFVSGSLFLSTTIFAATAVTPPVAVVTPPVATGPQAVVIANVNISGAKIISQKNNIFHISFTLKNGKGVQAGVKYGVQLVSTDPKNSYMVDEKVYSQSLTLPENVNFIQNLSYTAPVTLSGTYNLYLMVENEGGLPFGRVLLGKVTLKATGEGLLISPSSCYLLVVGEKDSPHYKISQNVDITKDEKLTLTCSVTNSTKNSVTVKPVFETLLQSAYGAVAPMTGGSIDAITIKSKENKTFTVTLPTASNPQVYSVSLKLSEGKIISNTVSASYVIRGTAATILNLILDKDFYKKGDKGILSLVYSLLGNDSKGRIKATDVATKLLVRATIVNDKGQECIKSIDKTQIPDINNPKIEIPISITRDCLNPKVTVVLSDDNGNVLDQKDFSIKSKPTPAQVPTSTPTKSNKETIIFIIIGLLVVLGVAYYFINLKKKPNETISQ